MALKHNIHQPTALITGGSNGIGSAIANKLLKNRMNVAVADVLPPSSNDVFFNKCDVTKAKEIDDLFEELAQNFSLPDILVLNAGRGIREKLTEGDPSKWEAILNTNLMGSLRCIRAFVPAMLKKKRGHVIFISSVAANQPHPYGGIYSASKTALEVVAETLRLETLPHIKISIIAPGITDTSFFDNEISGDISINDLGPDPLSPQDIAEDVWYILNKPGHAVINKLITRPANQSF
tara:strand:- start:4572 stop:5279 length:708 start_codon:yes stop_codon:yes gene_type:complete